MTLKNMAAASYGERAGVYAVGCDERLLDALGPWARDQGLFFVVYESVAVFLKEAPRLAPGCVVAERLAGDRAGVEFIRAIRRQALPFGVILIASAAETGVAVAVEAMRAGAADVLQDPVDPQALLAAVRRNLGGHAAAPADAPSPPAPARRAQALTPREGEVLRGVLAGKTNRQIAQACGISQRTVEAYRASLMAKMGVTSAAALVRRALEGPPGPDGRADDRPPSTRIH